jgi:hypothetical protein
MPRINLANNLRADADLSGALLMYNDGTPDLRLTYQHINAQRNACYIDYGAAIANASHVNQIQLDYPTPPHTDTDQVTGIMG